MVKVTLAAMMLTSLPTSPEALTDQQLMDYYHGKQCEIIVDDVQRDHCWDTLAVQWVIES